VVVLGATSGVGVACMQLAKAAGSTVIAVASNDEKRALCTALGADRAIGYEMWRNAVMDFTDREGADVVIDHVGKDTWADSLRAARAGGRVLTCGATTGYDVPNDLRQVFFRQLEVIGSTMGSAADLRAALRLYTQRGLRLPIAARMPLEAAASAHLLLEERRAAGKVVLELL
jgi:NADPH:quinone reductase-like Zn-dependent oxidoreductase